MKLDYQRIAERAPLQNLETARVSLKEEAQVDGQHFKNKRLNHVFHLRGSSILHLYNIEMVEYVREAFFDGVFVPVDWPHQATHQLIATSWTHRDLLTPDRLYASSVCAVPLEPTLRKTRLVVRKTMPKGGSVYCHQSSLEGKRAVVRFLCVSMKAKFNLRLIQKMTAAECDQVYTNLCRASKLLRRKRGQL